MAKKVEAKKDDPHNVYFVIDDDGAHEPSNI